MVYLTENNWYDCKYGPDNLDRQSNNLEFKVIYKKCKRKAKSLKKELLYIASSTLDHYNTSSVDVLFSGGAESELVLRSYKDIGANVTAYIFRYEKNFNQYDIDHATRIANDLNVPFKIIDFNLENFYKNDASIIAEQSQIDRPRALPYCKFLELTDNLPVLGEGDHFWHRYPDTYSVKGSWLHIDLETFFGWFKYAKYKNIPSIPQFFRWTPEYTVSYMNLKWFNRLLNDEFYGKLGTNSTKLIGYREAYPDMIDRIKQTGFESINHIINEFESFLHKKYNGLPFRNIVFKTPGEIYKEIL